MEEQGFTSHSWRLRQQSVHGDHHVVITIPSVTSMMPEGLFISPTSYSARDHICCGICLFMGITAFEATLQKATLMGPGPVKREICLGQFIMFGDGAF